MDDTCKEIEKNIWLLRGHPEYLDGWYFSDETERFDGNGPFGTIEECRDELNEYCIWLGSPVSGSTDNNPKEESNGVE